MGWLFGSKESNAKLILPPIRRPDVTETNASGCALSPTCSPKCYFSARVISVCEEICQNKEP